MRLSRDIRTRCRCNACEDWRKRGCPTDEPLEQWRPWEPPDAPVHPLADWIETRAAELVAGKESVSFLTAWKQARYEAANGISAPSSQKGNTEELDEEELDDEG